MNGSLGIGTAAGEGGHAPLKRSNGGQAIAPRFSSALASRGQDGSPHHASQPFAPSNADHQMREFISSEAVQIVVCRKPNWDRYCLESEERMSTCSHQQMTNHHDADILANTAKACLSGGISGESDATIQ
jgi:hypothetical protein